MFSSFPPCTPRRCATGNVKRFVLKPVHCRLMSMYKLRAEAFTAAHAGESINSYSNLTKRPFPFRPGFKHSAPWKPYRVRAVRVSRAPQQFNGYTATRTKASLLCATTPSGPPQPVASGTVISKPSPPPLSMFKPVLDILLAPHQTSA